MKKLLFPLLVLSMGLALTAVSCTSEDAPLPAPDPIPETPVFEEPVIVGGFADDIILSESQKIAFDAINQYGWDLAYALQGDDNQENFLFSPLSACVTLSMTANGASGATLSEMVAALGNNGAASLEDINSLNSYLSEALQKVDPGSRLGLANSIWVDNSNTVADSFRKAIEENYRGNFFRKDLATEETRNEINNWVYNNTCGLIPELLKERINGKVALINALGFKAVWLLPFLESTTYDGTFTTANGTESKVRMMSQKTSIFQYCSEDVDAVKHQFGNRAFSMVIISPTNSEGVNLKKLFATVPYQTILDGINEHAYTTLELPRFKLDTFYELNDAVKKTGMPNVFTKNADFSKIGLKGDETLIMQNSVLDVNENGATAASATYNAPFAGWVGYKDYIKFDHPFAFVIKENSTGAILFIGVVNKL